MDARAEADLFQTARKQVSPNALYVNGNNTAENVLKVAARVLEARLAPNLESAIVLWKKAVEEQVSLCELMIFDLWPIPVLE